MVQHSARGRGTRRYPLGVHRTAAVPHFLYRAELGSQEDGEYKLSQYEIASQLAFNLTGLPPDADLMMQPEMVGSQPTATGVSRPHD